MGGTLLSNEIGSGDETSSWVGTSTGTSFETRRSAISGFETVTTFCARFFTTASDWLLIFRSRFSG